jgi:hypothetical protein
MAESRDVLDRLDDRRGLVVPHGGEAAVRDGPADHDRGEPELDERVDPRVVTPHVDEEDAIDPMLAEPAAVHLDLLLHRPDELEREPDRAGGELRLDACDQLHEERLERDRRRRTREHEPERIGT